MRWAVINLETKIVENIIIWDGSSPMYGYDYSSFVQLQDNELCNIGDIYEETENPRFVTTQHGEV